MSQLLLQDSFYDGRWDPLRSDMSIQEPSLYDDLLVSFLDHWLSLEELLDAQSTTSENLMNDRSTLLTVSTVSRNWGLYCR